MSVGSLKPYRPDSKDPTWSPTRDFMKARLPNVDPANFAAGYGYMVAQALVVVLEQCKNDLSRDNIMAQAANLKNVPLPLLMPGSSSTPRRRTIVRSRTVIWSSFATTSST